MSKSTSKKGLKIFLFLLLAGIAAAAVFFFVKAGEESEADKMFTLATNAERVEFLNDQGWIVKPDPVSKEEITVPSSEDSVFAEYAELMTQQGFDLEKYSGKPASLVTYLVLNYPDHPENVTASMLFVNNRLIGGYISMPGDDGFTVPLISAAARTYLSADTEK